MTDDLAKRLREFDPNWDTWEVVEEAADAIEALTADNAKLRADMRHIVTYVAEPSDLDGDTINALRGDLRFVGRVARAALNGKEQP
jgi:hypothetical protein